MQPLNLSELNIDELTTLACQALIEASVKSHTKRNGAEVAAGIRAGLDDRSMLLTSQVMIHRTRVRVQVCAVQDGQEEDPTTLLDHTLLEPGEAAAAHANELIRRLGLKRH